MPSPEGRPAAGRRGRPAAERRRRPASEPGTLWDWLK